MEVVPLHGEAENGTFRKPVSFREMSLTVPPDRAGDFLRTERRAGTGTARGDTPPARKRAPAAWPGPPAGTCIRFCALTKTFCYFPAARPLPRLERTLACRPESNSPI
jgi:hypothetical protein